MLIKSHHAKLQLRAGDHLRIRGASKVRLTTVSGYAWVTAVGSARDTVIVPGDSLLIPTEKEFVVGPLFASVTMDLEDLQGRA